MDFSMTAPTDIVVPLRLYMRRKTFECPLRLLRSRRVNALVQEIYSKGFDAIVAPRSNYDPFWLRELVYYRCMRESGMRYEEFLPGRQYTYLRVADILGPLIPQNGSALEAGCGSALACALLARRGIASTGLDSSRGALMLAQQVALDFGTNIDTCHANFNEMPFKDGQFDLVYGLGTLEHLRLREQSSMLLECARVSRAYVVMFFPNVASPIYKAMAQLELSRVAADRVFPGEDSIHAVSLTSLASLANLRLLETGAIHIVPPRKLPAYVLRQGSFDFFRELLRRATCTTGCKPLDIWSAVESSVSRQDLEHYGWFSFGIFGKKPLR
jgi:ubiquinone/menaquinone biosynthesis C-methylase UbiE